MVERRALGRPSMRGAGTVAAEAQEDREEPGRRHQGAVERQARLVLPAGSDVCLPPHNDVGELDRREIAG